MFYRKDPKKDSLNLFRYQPTRRFAHSPRDNDPPSAPESKRKKLDTSNEKVTEDMMENLEKFIEPHEKETSQYSKSIKWRSPLIYSPPVKFSPKIPSSFTFSVPMPRHNDSENSHDWSLNTEETNNSSKTVKSLTTPNRNQSQIKTQNQGTKFLLSDKECNIAENPVNNNSQNISVVQTPQKSRQLQDFFSSSFLEDMGYSEKQKMTSNLRCFSQKRQDLNSSVQSAGSYYHDMVAKNKQDEQNSEILKHISQKPFFLNQNHLTFPENKNSDFNVIPSNNQLLDQSFSQRNFVTQNIPIIPNRNIPTQAGMEQHGINNHWLTQGPSVHNNIPSGNFARPECNFTAPNSKYNNIGNFWPYNANSNLQNQNATSVSSQQECKYPPVGHHDIYCNTESNNSQSSFTNANQINNFAGGVSQFGINRPMAIPQLNQTMAHTYEYNTNIFDKSKTHPFPEAYPPEYLKNSYYLRSERENSNYQMDAFNNLYTGNQNPDSKHGFFLNETGYPRFEQGSKTGPMWNTFCISHKIFNCRFCMDQSNSLRPNINMVNSFERSKSFNGTNSFGTKLPANRGPELPKEYSDNTSFAPFNQQYVNGLHRDNSFVQHAGIAHGSYGLESFVQPKNSTLGYNSDRLNKFGRQGLNIPSEMAYQDFPTRNGCDENQMSMREQISNKNYLISKFLNSFDDSLQNQK